MELEKVNPLASSRATFAVTFNGVNQEECQELVDQVLSYADKEDRTDDPVWMAKLASTCFVGRALRWYVALPADVQTSWTALQEALLSDYPRRLAEFVEPARIRVEDWDSIVFPSPTLLPIGSRDRWLSAGRERRKRYEALNDKSLISWLLVEERNRIPDNAIRTGTDLKGKPLYSARTYLTSEGILVGKHGLHLMGPSYPHDDSEIVIQPPVEILVGDSTALSWVTIPPKLENGKHAPISSFSGVEGGFQLSGRQSRATFISRMTYQRTMQPGKVNSGDSYAYAGFDGRQWRRGEIQLLAWVE